MKVVSRRWSGVLLIPVLGMFGCGSEPTMTVSPTPQASPTLLPGATRTGPPLQSPADAPVPGQFQQGPPPRAGT